MRLWTSCLFRVACGVRAVVVDGLKLGGLTSPVVQRGLSDTARVSIVQHPSNVAEPSRQTNIASQMNAILL